jgi:hypothetical protein
MAMFAICAAHPQGIFDLITPSLTLPFTLPFNFFNQFVHQLTSPQQTFTSPQQTNSNRTAASNTTAVNGTSG